MSGMEGELAGKVALVTGAGSGIGRATALRFAAEGARVALVGRTEAKLAAVAQEIKKEKGVALVLPADVSVETEVDRVVARVSRELGAVDIAFNNAGTLGSMAPIAQMEASAFDEIVATNLRGVWLMSRAEIRAMQKQKSPGSIINTSSFVAKAAAAGTTAYAASKAGVDALTRALALEVGSQGIRVNSVAPGVIETPMFNGASVSEELRHALANHAALRRLDHVARFESPTVKIPPFAARVSSAPPRDQGCGISVRPI